MNIDNALDKLNEFKKVAKKIKGECELVGFTDDSFTFKIQFDKKKEDDHKTIVGFAQTYEKRRSR